MNVYFHIPFCIKKCRYCNFTSYVYGNDNLFEKYMEHLKLEFNNKNITGISSVYIGGGSPSIIPLKLWSSFFKNIMEKIEVSEKEITMEINPRDASEEYIRNLKSFGVNRISMGVQSFEDKKILKYINRDSSKTVYKALENICRFFDNVNIDVIMGLPFSNHVNFGKDLEIALQYPISHISVYDLENYNQLDNLPSDDELYRMDKIKKELLELNGFERYEISNYCRNEKYCIHNLDFWNMKDYSGFGCSAVGQTGRMVRENPESLNEYFKGEYKEYMLNDMEYFENYISRPLRTKFGIVKSDFENKFGKFPVMKKYKEFIDINNNITVSEEGFDILNLILDRIIKQYRRLYRINGNFLPGGI